MIDTVRYFQDWEILSEFPVGKFFLTLDRKTGLRVGGCNDRITWVEVSLPRLLFGDNNHLIDSQSQIKAAFAEADKIISKTARPLTTQKRFTRVDLVWHFPSNPPERFFFCHEHCNHPEVKKSVGVFRNNHKVNTVEWRGDRMTIRMYDKTSKKAKQPRQIVRVEIELRGRKLNKKLNSGSEVHELDLLKCYSAYRATLRKFHPQKVKKIGSKDEALIFAAKNGVDIIERLASSMKRKASVRELRKKIATHLFKHYKIDWDKLLPKTWPPKKFDAAELKCPTIFSFRKAKAKSRLKKRV